MRARLMALAAAIIIIITLPLQPSWSTMNDTNQPLNPIETELPSALAEDDSFDDLPFEQLRQALREEVERDPSRNIRPHSPKRYNLLIR